MRLITAEINTNKNTNRHARTEETMRINVGVGSKKYPMNILTVHVTPKEEDGKYDLSVIGGNHMIVHREEVTYYP